MGLGPYVGRGLKLCGGLAKARKELAEISHLQHEFETCLLAMMAMLTMKSEDDMHAQGLGENR